MTTDTVDPKQMISALLARGWRWSESTANLLVHHEDHELCVRYSPQTGKLSLSPKLEEHLALVIPTPAKKRHGR
jgi:hypothetical protein